MGPDIELKVKTRLAQEALSPPRGGTGTTNYIRLVTKGRRTGLPHIVELRFALIGGSFYVVAGNRKSDWVQNLLLGKDGTIRLGDRLFAASAALATEDERRKTLAEYKRKYGSTLVRRWYGVAEACLRLTPEGPPTIRGGGTGEFEAKTTLLDWRRSGGDYYSDVAAAFDSASDEYDFTIGRNFINTWIRRRSLEILRHYSRPNDQAVEIGCGTGAEALQVARFVSQLVATDVSQKMIALVKAKVRARGLEGKVIPLGLSAAEISRAAGAVENGTFGFAYSLNGALNCEPRMAQFVRSLHDVLAPGGYFVCSVRNTICLSEVVSHAAVLQFDRMNPRKRQPIMVSVGGLDIPSMYYSPKTFMRFFLPLFRVRKVIALPGLLPPAYLSDYFLSLGGMTSVLEKAEGILSSHFPLNRLGDQTLFVFQRNP